MLALVVAAVVIVMTVTMLVLGARTGQLRWTSALRDVGFAALFVAAAWVYPRASSLLPMVLAVRFAVYRERPEHPWTDAQAAIRFETPYR